MNWTDFVTAAENSQMAAELPAFEMDAAGIQHAMDGAIAKAEATISALLAIGNAQRNFENTCSAWDRLFVESGVIANRIYLMKEVHPDVTVREAATEAIKRFQQWAVGVEYREDVYLAFKAYADSAPELAGEHKKYLEETMRDFRRSGMALPLEKRLEIESLRKRLSDLETDFHSNITQAQKELVFDQEEMEGVPESFLNAPGVRQPDGRYRVMANVTWQSMMVMDYARRESTRMAYNHARLQLCRESNPPLLDQIIRLRQEIATKLGYASWADFRTEVRMAASADRVRQFLENLQTGLKAKFQGELEAFRQIKVRETGNPDARIQLHDFRYYQNLYKKEQFEVDSEELRHFFAYDKVLMGMFEVFGLVFGITISRVEAPVRWVEDLELYVVSDTESGSPLGALYLDMFPREGKYNHFAQFGLIPGHRREDGRYQCPVVALICNFALPEPGKPSLLNHNEVETLFHEFGHAMHSILTQAGTNRFSGTSVDHDFVEVPSQILEFWAWDKVVLDRFARDHRDGVSCIPGGLLEKMKAADKAVKGSHYTRQVAFSLLDIELHRARDLTDPIDAIAESNRVLSEIFMEYPAGSAFAAYFGHLCGYDAGYYSYAWADAIAADLNTVFRLGPDGYLDPVQGKRLRHIIFAPGGARDPNQLVSEFLGRPTSLGPFLESIGAIHESHS